MAKEPMRDVVVIMPGLLGSVLSKDGRDVWGLTPGALFNGLLSLGGSMKALELIDDDPVAPTLDDGVIATRLMPDAHLVPGLWKIDGYSRLCSYVKATFDVTPGQNYFEFPYDWRRDLRSSARRLRVESADWLRNWRHGPGEPDSKLVILAHSLGGVVARTFAALEEGAGRDIRRLITFGTPYRGSVNGLHFLANGWRKGVGPVPLLDLTNMVRSLTSLHQLLPVYPCIRDDLGNLHRVAEVPGIEGVDQQRAKEGLALANDVSQMTEDLHEPYETHVIVGIEQPTWQGAQLRAGNPARIDTRRDLDGSDGGGDGTVPRVAAFPLEWNEERHAFYTADRHSSLQNADPALQQVKGILTARKLDLYRAGRDGSISMDLDDWYPAGKPTSLKLRQRPVYSRKAHLLLTRLWNADTAEEVVSTRTTVPPEEWQETDLGPLAPGLYRVRVEALDMEAVDHVEDMFVVLHDN